ncbi:cobalamin-dependent protein [Paenibacillus thermotolerans]|uniref:cobalamin-dependent protein n=1 Tax=Paenibacillus thermotolerans TaxID=3027807 RepID=UPI002368D26E|nr:MULTISPECIES: cobalamin-dependent protein [unclassified Paenibacillus]
MINQTKQNSRSPLPRTKVLIAKAGLDGHDRGAIILVKALRELGLEATFSGVRRTPKEIAAMAVERDADCVGLSSHSGAHLMLFPLVIEELRAAGWDRGLIIAGGLIPEADHPALLRAGVSRIFRPESPIPDIAAYIRASAASVTSIRQLR